MLSERNPGRKTIKKGETKKPQDFSHLRSALRANCDQSFLNQGTITTSPCILFCFRYR